MADTEISLAIVGFGPRGLGAVEAVFERSCAQDVKVRIDIFDPKDTLGSGPNFDQNQSDLCLLNIPTRALDIPPSPRISDHISSFEDWSKKHHGPDDYPARSEIGSYLNARFDALCIASAGRLAIRHIPESVSGIRADNEVWTLSTDGAEYGPYHEVLMTQGQPQTRPDDQLARWREHAAETRCALLPAYPANDLIAAAQDWAGKTVAIRGLGLSTFDALRLLTFAQGGAIVDGRYVASGREPALILPFSLNGQPPAAKPATAALDSTFDPTRQETEAFERALKTALSQSPNAAMVTIRSALVPTVSRILKTTETADIEDWLAMECEEAGAQENEDAIASLKSHIAMATGQTLPSIGYVIGQIWRKWQNALRHSFNATDVDAKTASIIIAFDEGLKRYSYGPPVAASQELLALINAGIVSLRAVDDPDVALTAQGWRLSDEGESEIATVMVDAVLPSPDLSAVTDPLMTACKSHNFTSIAVENMGAKCRPDGQVLDPQGNTHPGLCMLGRLTMGSVIAADSLHDCFGQSADRWAEGLAARHQNVNHPTRRIKMSKKSTKTTDKKNQENKAFDVNEDPPKVVKTDDAAPKKGKAFQVNDDSH